MFPNLRKDTCTAKTIDSLLGALRVTSGVFVGLFVVIHIAGALYVSHIGQQVSHALNAGISADLAYLKGHVEALSNDGGLREKLLARDADGLLVILNREKETRSLGTLAVADAEGVVVSRTLGLGVKGDNVFLTVPEGQEIAKGNTVENIGRGVVDPSQIRMTAGRPIMDHDRMIGGIFSSYIFDDGYAAQFRHRYLPEGAEVLFYNREFGVKGSSISDPEEHFVANSYFNSGSDWIRSGSSGKTVSFGGNRYYLVENVVFEGFEGETGGALILVPRQDFSGLTHLVTALLTLLAFFILATRHHMSCERQDRDGRYYVLLLLFCIPVLALAFLALRVNTLGILRLERVPFPLYNSTLRLEPEFGIYDLGFEQTFSVVVDTGDEAVNVVELELEFDPQVVEVRELETSTSTCAYVVENRIDTELGRASLVCGIARQGGASGRLAVADVVVVPKRVGTFTISFGENSKVLAHDGLGTNVLRMAQSGSYSIDNFDPDSGRAFVVFSPTHSNRSRWYRAEVARFLWRGDPGAVYRYAFDTYPDTVPDNTRTIQNRDISIAIPGDGVFYFHLQLASGGPVAHYRIQSDRTPPRIVSMQFSDEVISAGDVVRMSFAAEDVASGIQSNYYVDLGNRLFLPIGSSLFVPFLEEGSQRVTLRVYDDAGNYTESARAVRVGPAQ